MEAPEPEPSAPPAPAPAPPFERVIRSLAAQRGVLNPAALWAARANMEAGDRAKAEYWLRKAYKLNTSAGIKQLLRGAGRA